MAKEYRPAEWNEFRYAWGSRTPRERPENLPTVLIGSVTKCQGAWRDNFAFPRRRNASITLRWNVLRLETLTMFSSSVDIHVTNICLPSLNFIRRDRIIPPDLYPAEKMTDLQQRMREIMNRRIFPMTAWHVAANLKRLCDAQIEPYKQLRFSSRAVVTVFSPRASYNINI